MNGPGASCPYTWLSPSDLTTLRWLNSGHSERADFHRLPSPDHTDLETLTFNVEMRVTAWLRRRGLLRDESDADAAADPAARSAEEGRAHALALRRR